MRCDNVASTLIRRHFNVVCPLGLLYKFEGFADTSPVAFLFTRTLETFTQFSYCLANDCIREIQIKLKLRRINEQLERKTI